MTLTPTADAPSSVPAEGEASKRGAPASASTPPPPAKRLPSSTSLLKLSPAAGPNMATAVYLVLWSGGSDAGGPSGATDVLGVYASLGDANEAVRERAVAAADGPAATDGKPEEAAVRGLSTVGEGLALWKGPEGAACWVEKKRVEPASRRPSALAAKPEDKGPKLYDNEEADDEIIEVEDGDFD